MHSTRNLPLAVPLGESVSSMYFYSQLKTWKDCPDSLSISLHNSTENYSDDGNNFKAAKKKKNCQWTTVTGKKLLFPFEIASTHLSTPNHFLLLRVRFLNKSEEKLKNTHIRKKKQNLKDWLAKVLEDSIIAQYFFKSTSWWLNVPLSTSLGMLLNTKFQSRLFADRKDSYSSRSNYISHIITQLYKMDSNLIFIFQIYYFPSPFLYINWNSFISSWIVLFHGDRSTRCRKYWVIFSSLI